MNRPYRLQSNWCHGDMTCTCGEVIAHQDALDGLALSDGFGDLNIDNLRLTARVAELEAALRSIAGNTCCDKCQEAALVARAALAKE